jgi:two-component system sensor histidine kinase PilS (NtrC family)
MSSDAADRPRRPSSGEESWFGSFDSTGDPPALGEDSRFAASWQPEPEPSTRRTSSRPKAMAGTTFERIYGAFIAARAALGVAVAFTLALTSVFGPRPAPAVVAITITYAALSISMWLLPRLRRGAAPHAFARLQSPQWIATIGADLLLFTGLHIASPESSINYVALLVLPVLMAGVLTPRGLALATAGVATLALLAAAWLNGLRGGDMTLLMTQAGLTGSGFFVITILAGELAGRLAREELSARGSLELARQQAQLNRLVIEEMEDGVLVVDRAGKVRAANPSARRLLAPEGTSRAAPFQLRGVPAWGALVPRSSVPSPRPPGRRSGATCPCSSGPTRAGPCACGSASRAAGSRQPPRSSACSSSRTCATSRRAAGRRSCRDGPGLGGIAHEIRNPLAAISQANALLAEDATDPGPAQLIALVTDNVERLKRIVDDVLEVDAGAAAGGGAIDATARSPPSARVGQAGGMATRARERAANGAAGQAEQRAVRRRAPAPRPGEPARQRLPPRLFGAGLGRRRAAGDRSKPCPAECP